MKIGYYVSGHGFGHATRSEMIIKTLVTLNHSVVVFTLAPSFIFKDLSVRVESSFLLDIGITQKDPLTLDVEKSFLDLESFLDSKDSFLEKELALLKSYQFDLVCLDAPFLPALAASMLDVPSILITNFTFDVIYEYMSTQFPKLKSIVSDCYYKVDYLIRLPGYISIPSFDNRSGSVTDVSLVVRKKKFGRSITREQLEIPLDSLCVLITFGGFQASDESYIQECIPNDWYAIVTCPNSAKYQSSEKIKYVDSTKYVPDLMEAVDVVVGKCGYGTCSEVVAFNRPFVYVSRPLFHEETGLLSQLMKPYGRCLEMPVEDYKSGAWAHYIEKALRLPIPSKQIPTNGHEQVCQRLFEIYDTRTKKEK